MFVYLVVCKLILKHLIMDLKAKTFWEMEKESISYLHKNENWWTNWAILASTVNRLEASEIELDASLKAQDANDPGGQVAYKNNLLETFYHKTYRLGRKLLLFAKVSGDQVLLNDVAFSESSLHKLTGEEALIKCHSVLQLANKYLDKTAEYGITADELKAFADELAELETLQPSIGMITNERKSAVRSVKVLIKEGSFILDMLDNGLEGIVDNDNFLAGWFAIRKIKGRPVYHKVIAPVN